MSESKLPSYRGQGILPNQFIGQRSPYTQFQSWLGETLGIIGCPINCQYCFFQLDGKTPTKPVLTTNPQEMVNKLREAVTYTPEMPINYGAETDAFSTNETIRYYAELLRYYGQSEYPNPLIFISKRSIPEEIMDIAANITQPVLFYISFSGLAGTAVEPTVKFEVLKQNFIRLKERGLLAIHYWRPFLPQNSTLQAINEVLGFITQNSICSIVNGLRLNDGIRHNMEQFWPELTEHEFDFTQSGEIWPEGIRNFLIRHVREMHSTYPVFFGNTPCSVAHALQQSDGYGHYNGSACKESNCQPLQRELCKSCYHVPSPTEVEHTATRVGIPPDVITIETNRIIVKGTVKSGKITYMRHALRFPVCSATISYTDGYNWANIRDEGNIIEVPWKDNWTK